PGVQDRLTAYNTEWYRVARRRRIRGARMEIAMATAENARARGVDLGIWRRELIEAAKVPPRTFSRVARRLLSALTKGRELRLTSPNGTDLKIPLRRHAPHLDDGIVDEKDLKAGDNLATVPAGDLLALLDGSALEGTLVSNAPSWFRSAHRMEGGRWEFRGGRLVSFDYQHGGEIFSEAYAAAAKGKELPALFEVGLNPALRHSPQLEDQALGAASVYIGANRAYGGANGVPFSAYLVLRDAAVSIDGTPYLQDGKVL
ncbi:MAG: hypothetical protein ACREC5_08275, partial [Thermoplasmata archaeon]